MEDLDKEKGKGKKGIGVVSHNVTSEEGRKAVVAQPRMNNFIAKKRDSRIKSREREIGVD